MFFMINRRDETHLTVLSSFGDPYQYAKRAPRDASLPRVSVARPSRRARGGAGGLRRRRRVSKTPRRANPIDAVLALALALAPLSSARAFSPPVLVAKLLGVLVGAARAHAEPLEARDARREPTSEDANLRDRGLGDPRGDERRRRHLPLPEKAPGGRGHARRNASRLRRARRKVSPFVGVSAARRG